MSNEFISNITLECLMNKEQYKKYKGQQEPIEPIKYRKDLRFYKRRIYDITKQLVQTEDPIVPLPADIKKTFRDYAESCIDYFRMLDKTDILQEDFEGIEDSSSNNIVPFTEEGNIDDVNQVLLRSIKIREPNSLEKLVKRKVTKKPEQIIHPHQKEVNLKDPTLKNKGICKKKNINNTYDGEK